MVLRSRLTTVIAVLATAALMAALLAPPLTAGAATAVQVNVSAPAQVYTGAGFTAPIGISQVNSLNAANFRITFDPAVIVLDGITDGSIGAATLPVSGYKEVRPGVCNVVNFTGGLQGLTGSGTLATLHFRSLGSTGQTDIAISNGVLSDTTANAIEANWTSASITVTTHSTGGGGGGGGGGGSIPATSTPGTTVLGNSIDAAGLFLKDVVAMSADNAAWVTIKAGIIGLTASGSPLSSISVTPVTNPAAAPANFRAGGYYYNIEPSGAHFSGEITITLPCESDIADPFIAWYNSETSKWEPLTTVSVDPTGLTVSAGVDHFTVFGVFSLVEGAPTTPATPALPSLPPTTTPPPGTIAGVPGGPTTTTTPPPAVPKPAASSNWLPIILIVAAAAALAVVAYLVLGRRRTAPK